MAYDTRKWVANDLARRPRRRGVRWLLVLALAVTLGMAMWQTIDPPRGVAPGLAFMWPPILAMMASPFARESWATERGLAAFDEFERTALARATIRAYATFLVLVTLLALWVWNSLRAGVPVPVAPATWLGWALALLSIGVALPPTFAEFMVPFPPAGDIEEDDL